MKPTVSADGFSTERASRATAGEDQAMVDAMAARSDVMIQRLVPEIRTTGELSLMFFGGAFSHAVNKRPARGEFRVQERLGGVISPAVAPVRLVRHATRTARRVRARQPLRARGRRRRRGSLRADGARARRAEPLPRARARRRERVCGGDRARHVSGRRRQSSALPIAACRACASAARFRRRSESATLSCMRPPRRFSNRPRHPGGNEKSQP